MDKPQKSARQIKEEKVKTLAEKIARAKTLAFVDYRGLTANQITELRAKIKLAGGEFLVEKNTLIKRALTSYQLPRQRRGSPTAAATSYQLTGPTATILAYGDEVSPIKEIAQSAKTLGVPTFKFGFLASQLISASKLEDLAKVPSRDVLYASVVGSLASPIYGFVNVLAANLRNLVSVLDQVAKRG